VGEVVRAWTGGARTSVKYEELFKIFKPLMGMSMSLSSFQKGKSVVLEGEPLKPLLEQLMKKEPDLVAFFRKHDLKENWIVDYKIEKVLRSYLKAEEETLRKALAEMWKKGSIEGDLSKQINYVYLLRNLGLYDNLQLLRLILTLKINEDGRQAFLEKYMRDQRGWNYLSFVDFNNDERLEFEDRELKSLFSELDSDRSGIIEPRELLFKLTGLKEFDYEAVVEAIRHALDKQGVDLFQSFKTLDSRARLVLGSPSDLHQVLESIGVELSEDHLNALFSKFARTGKFEYLAFLRLFTPLERLFLTATKFVLREHYRNDFDKLFAMGVREGRKKWNRQSLALVSEEMVLGFREAELGEIWGLMDPHGEGSLTKEEVAEAFSYEVEKRDELTRKQVQSIKDLPRKKQEEEAPAVSNKRVPTGKDETNREEAIAREFQELGEKKLIGLASQLLQESEDRNGQIEVDSSIRVFDSCGIRPKKAEMVRFLARFKELENGRRTILNFVALLFFLADSFPRQEEAVRLKSAISLNLIREIKKAKGLTN
jgi:Ca2+-binding EF-hand superfamily protein